VISRKSTLSAETSPFFCALAGSTLMLARTGPARRQFRARGPAAPSPCLGEGRMQLRERDNQKREVQQGEATTSRWVFMAFLLYTSESITPDSSP